MKVDQLAGRRLWFGAGMVMSCNRFDRLATFVALWVATLGVSQRLAFGLWLTGCAYWGLH